MKPVSGPRLFVYGTLLGLLALLGVVPCTVVAAQSPTADKAEPKEESTISGKFASFKDGVLKVKVPDGPKDKVQEREWKIADDTPIVSHIRGIAQEGTARDAFKLWEDGAVIAVKVQDGKVISVEIGNKPADPVPGQTPEKSKTEAAPKPRFEYGRFESCQDGTLTISLNSGAMQKNQIPENAKTLVWNNDEDKYVPADTAVALQELKAGTWVVINIANDNVTIRLRSRKGSTTGTFVSFKDNRLLILGKNLDERFTKKYGNNLHFNRFRDDVPAYESIDGGEYELIGTANKVLGNVKEGTILTVHAEGDDNITLIQIGVPNEK